MKKVNLNIDGMHCSMCESHVNDVLRDVKGVKKASSNYHKNTASVITEDDIDVNEIVNALSKEGYKVIDYKVEDYVKKPFFSFLHKNK